MFALGLGGSVQTVRLSTFGNKLASPIADSLAANTEPFASGGEGYIAERGILMISSLERGVSWLSQFALVQSVVVAAGR